MLVSDTLPRAMHKLDYGWAQVVNAGNTMSIRWYYELSKCAIYRLLIRYAYVHN